MEDFFCDFDPEFKEMSVAERLYAEALAHLIDKGNGDYVKYMKEGGASSLNVAAEQGDCYW